MRSRDVVIGFIVIVVLISVVLLVKKARVDKFYVTPVQTPSIEARIKDTFNGIIISDDTDRVELSDISGGESYGIATKTEILANLPELPEGKFYSVTLTKNEDLIKLGNMRKAKGGFVLEYNFSNYTGYRVTVLEDLKPILVGSL